MRVFACKELDDYQMQRLAGEMVNMETGVEFFINGILRKTPKKNYDVYERDGMRMRIRSRDFSIVIDPLCKQQAKSSMLTTIQFLKSIIAKMYEIIKPYEELFKDRFDRVDTEKHLEHVHTVYIEGSSKNYGDDSFRQIRSARTHTSYTTYFNWIISTSADAMRQLYLASDYSYNNIDVAESICMLSHQAYAPDNTRLSKFLCINDMVIAKKSAVFPRQVHFTIGSLFYGPLIDHLYHVGFVPPAWSILPSVYPTRALVKDSHPSTIRSFGEVLAFSTLSPATYVDVKGMLRNTHGSNFLKDTPQKVDLMTCAVSGVPLAGEAIVITFTGTNDEGKNESKHFCLNPFVYNMVMDQFVNYGLRVSLTVIPKSIETLLNEVKDSAGAKLVRAMMASKPLITRTTDKSDLPSGVATEFGKYILANNASDLLSCFQKDRIIVTYY